MDQEVEKELAKLRGKIDRLDEKIVQLLQERAQMVLAIKELKKEAKLPVHDPQREEEILTKIRQFSNGPLTPKTIQEIYRKILKVMKASE